MVASPPPTSLFRDHFHPAKQALRTLHQLRTMTIDPADKTKSGEHIRWGVVLTNAIGVVVGLALTASVSGVIFLAWTVPSSQQRIIENQEQLGDHIDKLDANDRSQDARLNRIEAARERL